MTASLINEGLWTWSLTRDSEGHREYTVVHRVTADKLDGPQTVMNTPGLPTIGSIWNFDNDSDAWAFCWPNMQVTPGLKGQAQTEWKVEQLFSTKPLSRCQDESIEDPLLEPQKVSGSFVKYTKEVTHDKDNIAILTSSHEAIRGPQAEFDHNRPTVRIQQNVAALGLETFSEMVDTVNDDTLWGLAARKIKLSNVSWERVLFGLCNFYYTRTFEFDINFSTFDREVLDEGTKVLNGHWDTTAGTGGTGGWVLDDIDGIAPDRDNPQHFMRAIDRSGNPIKIILDGNGEPSDADIAGTGTTGSPGTIDIQYYSESNFLLLGIPTSF